MANNLDNIDTRTFTVSQLNRRVKDLLEIHLPLVWVEGELSNLSRPASGHWYFTLKDETAQVSCAMFKRANSSVRFTPKSGDHVKLRAHVSLYEERGNYQLIAEHMEDAGFGLLQRRFEELKHKLQGEGLFDAERKRALPCPPRHLAVITSPTGAAIRDVLSVLRRRFPALPVTVLPSPVQGEEAAPQLIRQLQRADTSGRFDAILLCRGGGSLEDLWAFNNEALARAIAACETPVVSAVGHEVDFSIADFVADVRAPTPSAAAELLSPDGETLKRQFHSAGLALRRTLLGRLLRLRERLLHLRRRLKHPRDRINQWQQALDHSERRLHRAMRERLQAQRNTLNRLQLRLHHASPQKGIGQHRLQVQQWHDRLLRATRQRLSAQRATLAAHMGRLHLVSPLATLERGYAIARDDEGGIVRSIHQVQPQTALHIRVSDGEIEACVTGTRDRQP